MLKFKLFDNNKSFIKKKTPKTTQIKSHEVDDDFMVIIWPTLSHFESESE